MQHSVPFWSRSPILGFQGCLDVCPAPLLPLRPHSLRADSWAPGPTRPLPQRSDPEPLTSAPSTPGRGSRAPESLCFSPSPTVVPDTSRLVPSLSGCLPTRISRPWRPPGTSPAHQTPDRRTRTHLSHEWPPTAPRLPCGAGRTPNDSRWYHAKWVFQNHAPHPTLIPQSPPPTPTPSSAPQFPPLPTHTCTDVAGSEITLLLDRGSPPCALSRFSSGCQAHGDSAPRAFPARSSRLPQTRYPLTPAPTPQSQRLPEARRAPISTLGRSRRDRAQYDSRQPGIHQSSFWSPRCLTGPVLTALQCPVLPSIGLLHPATTARHTERTGAWPIVTSACHPNPHPPAARPNPT